MKKALLPLFLFPIVLWAQEEREVLKVDSLVAEEQEEALVEEVRMVASEMYVLDSLLTEKGRSAYVIDSLMLEAPIAADSLLGNTIKIEKPRRDWTTWKPSPKRAMWLALVFPGAGQIYNRKYWKLPIFYGGFVGCAYAWSWNNQMYQDYRQAYLDIMDDDDSTHSYDQFLHLGNTINESNLSRYQQLFSKRKDRYRRYRDLSLFCIIAVYALSVIDAYVDASLSEFDISDDLSLHVEPAYVSTKQYNNPLKGGGLGVQCSLSF